MIVNGLLPMGLPSSSFVAGSFEIVARRRIHSLPELSNPVDGLLLLPLVNRYFEGLLTRGTPEKGNCQVAAHIRFWLWYCDAFRTSSICCEWAVGWRLDSSRHASASSVKIKSSASSILSRFQSNGAARRGVEEDSQRVVAGEGRLASPGP